MCMYLNSLHVHYMQHCLGCTDMRKKCNFLVNCVVQHTLNVDHIHDSPFKTSNTNLYHKCEPNICKQRPQATGYVI
jgi:hypothetical protein